MYGDTEARDSEQATLIRRSIKVSDTELTLLIIGGGIKVNLDLYYT